MNRLGSILRTPLMVLTLGLQAQASAQGPPPPLDPAGTVRAFWEAILKRRWAEAVQYLELTDLEQYRREQAAEFRAYSGPAPLTVEDLLKADPQMPRAVAEYEVRRRASWALETPAVPFPDFAGIESVDHLERLPIEDVAQRWLQASDPILTLERYLRTNGCPRPPSLDSMLRTRRTLVYGGLAPIGDTAFVLFTDPWFPGSSGGYSGRSPQVARLVRSGAGWRISPRGDLLRGRSASLTSPGCRPR